jgi:hypothetical protein
VLLAAHLLTPRLAQIAPFLGSCPMHDPEDTTLGPRDATPLDSCGSSAIPSYEKYGGTLNDTMSCHVFNA